MVANSNSSRSSMRKIDKLKQLILLLDTLVEQGFIDTSPQNEFNRRVRLWLVDVGLAGIIKGKKRQLWIYPLNPSLIEELKQILLEATGYSVEQLWQEELGKYIKPSEISD